MATYLSCFTPTKPSPTRTLALSCCSKLHLLVQSRFLFTKSLYLLFHRLHWFQQLLEFCNFGLERNITINILSLHNNHKAILYSKIGKWICTSKLKHLDLSATSCAWTDWSSWNTYLIVKNSSCLLNYSVPSYENCNTYLGQLSMSIIYFFYLASKLRIFSPDFSNWQFQ